MVEDVILNTKKNLKKYKVKNLKDVYLSRYPIVEFSDKMKFFDKRGPTPLARKHHLNLIIFLRMILHFVLL